MQSLHCVAAAVDRDLPSQDFTDASARGGPVVSKRIDNSGGGTAVRRHISFRSRSPPSQRPRAHLCQPPRAGARPRTARGRNGERSATCAGRTAFTVWGTDVYTDDSSVCTAAAHACVTFAGGSTISIEIRAGQGFTGSTLNGVTTRRTRLGGSFVVASRSASSGAPLDGRAAICDKDLCAGPRAGVGGALAQSTGTSRSCSRLSAGLSLRARTQARSPRSTPASPASAGSPAPRTRRAPAEHAALGSTSRDSCRLPRRPSRATATRTYAGLAEGGGMPLASSRTPTGSSWGRRDGPTGSC